MSLSVELLDVFSCSENQRDTPDAGKSHDGVNDAAEERVLSATNPCHDVKGKQTDATPVESADNGDDQRNAIHDHGFFHPFLELWLVCCNLGFVIQRKDGKFVFVWKMLK